MVTAISRTDFLSSTPWFFCTTGGRRQNGMYFQNNTRNNGSISPCDRPSQEDRAVNPSFAQNAEIFRLPFVIPQQIAQKKGVTQLPAFILCSPEHFRNKRVSNVRQKSSRSFRFLFSEDFWPKRLLKLIFFSNVHNHLACAFLGGSGNSSTPTPPCPPIHWLFLQYRRSLRTSSCFHLDRR